MATLSQSTPGALASPTTLQVKLTRGAARRIKAAAAARGIPPGQLISMWAEKDLPPVPVDTEAA
jgi:hypothetical protein